MKLRVLGSAAGGGFPQWNCNCRLCSGVRNGKLRAQPRTQSSVAVTENGQDWLLVNASPDVRSQLQAVPGMQPGRDLRDTGIRGIALVDSQIDHTAGLLSLREGMPLQIYCTENCYRDLTKNFPILDILSNYCPVTHHSLKPDGSAPFTVNGVQNLKVTTVDVKSKAPPYSPNRVAGETGDNIALLFENTATGRKVFYAPGLERVSESTLKVMQDADCVLVDGTFWAADDMAANGVGSKLAQEMGHLPITGKGGMLDILRGLGKRRKVLIHINNTNPILDEDSDERKQVESEGIEVAYDGMELEF